VRRLLVLFAGSLAVAALASGGQARTSGDIVRADKAGDAKVATKLSAAQLAALDIKSVHVYGDSRIGFLVDVAFKGKPAAQLGKGKLADAGIGLVIGAPSGLAPAGIYSAGAGALGKTLTKTKSQEVGVFRDGQDVSFFLRGPGFENIESIRVATYADTPFGLPSLKPGYGSLSTAALRKIVLGSSLADLEVLTHGDLDGGGLDDLDCDELDRLVDVLDEELTKLEAFENVFGSSPYLTALMDALDHMGEDASDILDDDCGPPPTAIQILFASWYYHAMPGVSYTCFGLSTQPMLPNASGSSTIMGPGVVGSMSKAFTTDAGGRASLSYQINAFGMYHLDTTLTANGKTYSGSSDVDVGAAQGSKTCP
jgi:hypothetical protein